MAARTADDGIRSITRRKRGFRFAYPLVPMWHVEVTGFGTHVVRDAHGHDPLQHPDPVTRLKNIHLAASAPTLREALILILQRFESMHDGWYHDDALCALAWTAIYECRPLASDEERLAAEGGQYHMPLEGAA